MKVLDQYPSSEKEASHQPAAFMVFILCLSHFTFSQLHIVPLHLYSCYVGHGKGQEVRAEQSLCNQLLCGNKKPAVSHNSLSSQVRDTALEIVECSRFRERCGSRPQLELMVALLDVESPGIHWFQVRGRWQSWGRKQQAEAIFWKQPS